MSEFLKAAHDDVLHEMQRLLVQGASVHEANGVGENALIVAIIYGHPPVVWWLVKKGGARISDVDGNGRNALSTAINFGRNSLAQWLLEEGGANITDTVVLEDGDHRNVWDHFNIDRPQTGLESLLKVIVLLDDAPTNSVAELSPQNADIVTQDRHIRALRPAYLVQQDALTETTCPLPTVLQSIIATYAEPTPEDMWTDWVQWM
jgi:ankyrin repeat protein